MTPTTLAAQLARHLATQARLAREDAAARAAVAAVKARAECGGGAA